MIEIQRLAVWTLTQVKGGRNLEHAITDARKQAQGLLSDYQRAALQDIGFGIQRHRTTVERVLDPLYLKHSPQPPLDALLMVAAYQLLFTRGAPHAVVSHAVEVAGQLSGEASKRFVNGVLRNLLRQKEGLLGQAQSTPEGRFSHPSWWIRKLQEQYPQHWQSLLEQAQKHPPMTLRVNRRRNHRDQYLLRLQESGLEGRAVGEDGLILGQPVAVERLPGFASGDVFVQDASAQEVPLWLGLHKGQRVLDACAAPGGKALHILERGNSLELWALERDPSRFNKLKSNFERAQAQARILVADSATPDDWWDKVPFDRILIDAPCSGSGVVRRHPDIKWLRRETDLGALGAEQQRLLEALWPLVRRGGRLLYVTCSLFKEENQDQRKSFMVSHPDAKEIGPHGEQFQDGQIMPDQDHDGFFYALFQKI